MEDDSNKSERLQYAREYAKENKDLYALLALSSPDDAKSSDVVQRAWRKASLKHHPDKAKVFDPEIWQLLERARDVLKDAEARAVYDAGRAAALREQKRREAQSKEKRAMYEDLLAREQAGADMMNKKRKVGGEGTWTEAKKRAHRETGAGWLEERRRMREEAEARERVRMAADGGGDTALSSGSKGRKEGAGSAWIPVPSDHNGTVASANKNTQENSEREAEEPQLSERQEQQQQPADEYDVRIADIERKLREREAERAARKAERKKSKKTRQPEDGNNSGGAGGGGKNIRDSETTTTTATAAQMGTATGTQEVPPVSPPTENQKPFSIPPTSIPTRQQQQQHQQPPFQTSTPTPGGGGVPSLMERLRAAQREKDRKMAEAAASASAAAVAPTATAPEV
ncbi:hypothetical protein F5Y08DRAFT_299170 [Xylaria arbuscula]|nr:hypothetical protein F5Y08DRAFT_299170 [Xylaria arbuscula]